MNKLKGLIFLYVIGTWTVQAQTDSLPAHFSQDEIMVDNPFARKWELSVHGGWSYRTAKLSDQVQSDFVNYINELRSGYHVGGDLDFFWREDMAAGLKYSRFGAKASIGNVVGTNPTTGETVQGSMSDDIAVNFIAPSFTYRYIFPNRKVALQAHYAIGYMSYINNSMVINEDIKITAHNFGVSLGAHLIVPLGQRLSLMGGVTVLGGYFSRFKVQNANGVTQTIEAEEDGERENVSRIDLSAGLRFSL